MRAWRKSTGCRHIKTYTNRRGGKFADKISQLLSKLDIRGILSSILLSKNLKIKVYKTIILPVVLYGCETDNEGGT